ncbi:MAG: hypothetical protein WBR18_09625 [Anaerolineales bacterium]
MPRGVAIYAFRQSDAGAAQHGSDVRRVPEPEIVDVNQIEQHLLEQRADGSWGEDGGRTAAALSYLALVRRNLCLTFGTL